MNTTLENGGKERVQEKLERGDVRLRERRKRGRARKEKMRREKGKNEFRN